MALIGLDIDGCIYPWTRAVNDAVEDRYGFKGLLFEHPSWDYLQETLDRHEWQYIWGSVGAPEVFGRKELIYPGLKNVVQRLCNEHQVHFVTHRNPVYTATLTSDYLRCHFTNYKGVHILDNAVSKADLMDWDLFVDDKPDTILGLQNAGILVMAPARPWNAESTCRRFESWDEVVGATA